MEQNSKVSVIVPVYNVEGFLDKCVQTIVEQTYRNLEIILIDDGSTDGSLKKCLEWKKKDERILVISKANEGVGLARNTGIRVACGEYVMFVDPDDYIAPGIVEKLFYSVKKNQTQVAFCNHYIVEGESKNCSIVNLEISKRESFKENQLLLTELPVYLWGKLFNRNFLVEHELWMTRHYIEDAEFTAKLVASGAYFSQVKECLYYYTVNRPGSIMTTKKDVILEHLPEIFDDIIGYIKQIGSFSEMKVMLEKYMLGKYYRSYYDNLNEKKTFGIPNEQVYKEKIEMKFQEMYGEGNLELRLDTKETFLIWGSPLLRGSVILYNPESYFCSGSLLHRYHFSSLIGAMSEAESLSAAISKTTNMFRRKMIENEMTMEMIKSENKIDVVLVDFMEERYDIAEYRGSYYTLSPEFQTAGFLQGKEYRVLARDSKETQELWYRSCDKFVKKLLELVDKEKIYLVKNYVHEAMGEYCCSVKEKRMNAILDEYYSYFEQLLGR